MRWAFVIVVICLFAGCREDRSALRTWSAGEEIPPHLFAEARERMLERQIKARGIENEAVLHALGKVPRHELVPADIRRFAYEDHPLPIGHDQTISQPYIVALMTALLDPEPGDIVLEVGTGSGYQAAVLAEIVKEVYSIEIVEPLARRAEEDLKRLGYEKVHVRAGDGYKGWPEAAPFDGIIVTAAPPYIPAPLLEQLATNGKLVAPVGPTGGIQELQVITRQPDGSLKTETVAPVRFVPMTGQAQEGGENE